MKMPRNVRMTRGADFRRVRETGRGYPGRFMVLSVLHDAEHGGGFRFGFITSRKVGGAVDRVRVRRRLRALVRDLGEHVIPGCHVVTIGRASARDAAFADLKREWLRLAARAGVVKDVGESSP